MNDKTYPYKAWKLMPSLKPVEVVVFEKMAYDGWYLTGAEGMGPHVHDSDLYESEDLAVAAGWAKVRNSRLDIAKRAEKVDKQEAVLLKLGPEPVEEGE